MRHVVLTFCGFLAVPVAAVAQAGAPDEPASINVFLDCQTRGCDTEHFRNEIEFVSWVRDRTVADVHLLITAQNTGGGTAYQLSYIGQRAFAGDSVTLPLNVTQTATEPERRELLTSRIAQGLMRYAVRSGVADRIRLELAPAREARAATAPAAEDPWNLWVFSAGLDVSTNGESREQSHEFELSLDASRIAQDWKLQFEIEGSYEEDRFELSDRTAIRVARNYSGSALVAHALAPLWSSGIIVEVGSSTFRNQDLYVRVAPVVEYSFFPYDEFSRRELTLRYSVGARHFNYADTTIYERTEERRLDHQLGLSLEFQQPWGQAGVNIQGSHYLHNIRRSNLSVFGGIDVRLFRGFSLEVFGSYARVHDQLYIAKGGDDPEDVLLRRRALETNYRYGTSVGVRYTFGSIYNNIVNPRLSLRGGGGR